MRERLEFVIQTCVAPSTLCFAPGYSVAFRLPRVANYLIEDAIVDEDGAFEAGGTVLGGAGLPTLIIDWISRRGTELHTRLPDSWPRYLLTAEETRALWPSYTEEQTLDLHNALADLDLAVYCFACCSPKCTEPGRVFFGLDILAHDCLNQIREDEDGYILDPNELARPIDYSLQSTPLHDHQIASARVIGLLGLEPTRARPVDLD